MKQKTELYSQPTCRVLVVRFEGSILTLSVEGNTISSAAYDEWEDEL